MGYYISTKCPSDHIKPPTTSNLFHWNKHMFTRLTENRILEGQGRKQIFFHFPQNTSKVTHPLQVAHPNCFQNISIFYCILLIQSRRELLGLTESSQHKDKKAMLKIRHLSTRWANSKEANKISLKKKQKQLSFT